MTQGGKEDGRKTLPHLLVAAASLLPATAYARTSPCHPSPRALAYACADPTLEAAISALGVAYDIAGENASGIRGGRERLRADQVRWVRNMGSCGTDEACLSEAVNQRQRVINSMRLGPPDAGRAESVEPTSRADAPRTPSPAYVPPYRDDGAGYGYPAPRTDWPEPPTAPLALPEGAIPPAHAATTIVPAPPADGADVSYGRMMLGMLLSASVPTLAAMLLLLRRRQPTPGPRCPECQGTHIRSRAVATGHGDYVRRMGRGNGMSEVHVERIVRTCPCGYSSDRPDVLQLTMDQRLPG